MKKLFTLFLITSLSSVFGFSQTETETSANWQTFAPANESFSIETPVALDKSLFKNSDSDKKSSRRYLNSFDGTYFFIFSDSPKKPANLEFVQKFVSLHNASGTNEKIGDFETEKFAFSDGADYYHTVLIAKSKNRSYVFQTVSPTKENPAVERFFNRLKLGTKLAEKTVEEKVKNEVNIPIPTSETENKPGVGGGLGSGRGNQTVPQTTPTPSKETRGIKILSKPRANYTDWARFYEITGEVMLHVTFSANGTIGRISPVTRLPFGLTEQAIIAARGIRFEPAMRAGVPYSVTKPVVYIFTIY